VLLIAGYAAIKQRRTHTHKWLMLTALAVSIAFLGCYAAYHVGLQAATGDPSKKFPGTGPVRYVYFAILITHVILAAAVPFLALTTIYRAFKARWEAHKKLARVTFPIWVYVSVTGVIIYFMVYHWPQ
jgi:protein SCO1/2/putative membrane protein